MGYLPHAMAVLMLWADAVLIAGAVLGIFLPMNLPYPGRLKVMRAALGMALIGLAASPWAGTSTLLFALALGVNAGVLGITIFLILRKSSALQRPDLAQQLEELTVQRAKLQQQLSHMTSVAKRDPNCVIEIDIEGNLRYLNPAADKALPEIRNAGKRHPALAGLKEILALVDRTGKRSLRRPVRVEERVFEQQINWSPETQNLCLYMTEVTEWKRLDQMKTELLNTVSHEFRTPLSSIIASATLVENELMGPINSDQKNLVKMIGGSAGRLNRLINELLDISKIEAGKFELKRNQVDLCDLLDSVARSFQPLAAERKLEMVLRIPPGAANLLLDGDKIVQVLTNLVNNALKFTERGKITLSLAVSDAEVVCAVEDTGAGIAADQLHRMFGKFQQVGAAVRGEKGTGLGLSLCKSLVELHQGKIWVDSILGHGTKFSFSLPRLAAQAVFDNGFQQLYEQSSSAGTCFSAFILHVEEAAGTEPFPGKVELALKLEKLIRVQLRSDRDLALREDAKIYFLINGVNKADAKDVIEALVADLIPLAAELNALDRIVLRAQHTSLPDDGTILEGLQARLAA